MESNTIPQHQGDEIVIAATSSALLLSPCIIELAHANQNDGPLMLLRLEAGDQLVLSAQAALNLAEAAEHQHSRGESLLVDVMPRDAELAKGGSRGISVECHVDTLLNRRLAAIRADIASQLAGLGLTAEQVETVMVRCVGKAENYPAAPALKFGDAVWLKSGGPEMKIAHIAESEGHTVAACTWPGEAGRLEIANYRVEQLSTVPVEPSEPTNEPRDVYAGVAETVAHTGRSLGMSDTSISQVTEQLTDGPAK